ncbi:MAG: YbfB/YjiJ family MFS transporter [Candidatus Thiodiazotropha sp.]
MSDAIARLKVLSAGIVSLILTLGIARFAYTPMLPLMQQQAGLGIAEGGWLASINYAGYLCGAIIASLISDLVLKDRLYRLGLVFAVLSTVVMGMTDHLWVWAASRFVAGLSSAAGLLFGSGLILNWLIRHDHRSELGIHFAGVGAGIVVCSALVEFLSGWFDWHEQWWILSLTGVVLLIPAWAWLPPPDTTSTTRGGASMHDNPPSRDFLRLFILIYFCAGVGYVVSTTFIVAIVEQTPGLSGSGTWTFLLLGLGATPACIIWDLIARRVGDLNALTLAFVLQVVGILLPALLPNLLMTLLGALLFGGTFIGIVSLVLTMAGRYYPTRPAKMMGKMTISYGVAQIAAPAVTGLIARNSGSYEQGLYLAAGVMFIGCLLMLRLKLIARRDASLS